MDRPSFFPIRRRLPVAQSHSQIAGRRQIKLNFFLMFVAWLMSACHAVYGSVLHAFQYCSVVQILPQGRYVLALWS